MLSSGVRQRHTRVMAKIDNEEMVTLLDTGTPFSSISLDSAHRVGMTTDSDGVTQVQSVHDFGGFSAESWLATFGSFQLDEEIIQPAKLRMFRVGRGTARRGWLDEIDAILGVDFFRSHHVLISNSLRKVYFTYAGGPVFQSDGPALESRDTR
jgi:hypothetical protein